MKTASNMKMTLNMMISKNRPSQTNPSNATKSKYKKNHLANGKSKPCQSIKQGSNESQTCLAQHSLFSQETKRVKVQIFGIQVRRKAPVRLQYALNFSLIITFSSRSVTFLCLDILHIKLRHLKMRTQLQWRGAPFKNKLLSSF